MGGGGPDDVALSQWAVGGGLDHYRDCGYVCGVIFGYCGVDVAALWLQLWAVRMAVTVTVSVDVV